MVGRIIKIAGFLLFASTIYAQSQTVVSIETWINHRIFTEDTGLDPGSNGSGLAVGVDIPLGTLFDLHVAGELGAAGISNYTAIKTGLNRNFYLIPGILIYQPGIHVLQGAGLFRPNLLYMYGVEELNYIAFQFKNSSTAGIVIGARFYDFPSYSTYSNAHKFFDITTGLKYCF